MLEDLNKIVPELDDTDKNKMFNDLNNNMNKPKIRKSFDFKYILAAASIVVSLAILIPLGIVMGNDNKKPPIDPIIVPNNDTNYNNHNFESAESILGYAAFKPFDVKTNNTNNTNLISINDNLSLNKASFYNGETEDNTNSFYVSYPFDYVRINSAFKFETDIEDIKSPTVKEIIEANCGLGKLEVVVAKFTTYTAEPVLKATIEETLISIRGYNGYYTILENSKSGDYEYEFSSHKKISSNEIIKDSTPPIIRIHLIKYSDGKALIGFFGCDDEDAYSDLTDFQFFNSSSNIESVNPTELYSVYELSKVPTTKIEAPVIDILCYSHLSIPLVTYYRLEVQTKTKLKYVFITVPGTPEDNVLDIQVGDTIIIEFDLMFASYDPDHLSDGLYGCTVTKVEK